MLLWAFKEWKEHARGYRGVHKVDTSKNEIIAKKEECPQYRH